VSFAKSLVTHVPFLLCLQLIRFSGDHQIWPPMRFEPVLQLAVALHPAPSCVQHQDREPQCTPSQQITFNQLFPLSRDVLGNFCETIPREIYKA